MNPPLPCLSVLATGGTIAGAQSGDGGYKSAALSIDSLIAAVPQIQQMAVLELEQVARIGSQDMDDALWLRLARCCQERLDRPEIAGVVITHGTDTMEETAYFLNLVLKSSKPVVLVGAMRPATAISADGPMNLFNAVAIASHPSASGRGVLVVANDEVHFARAISKTNTTQVGTFKSINRGLAALVQQGRVHWFRPPAAGHTLDTPFRIEELSTLPRVDIVYAHAGMHPTFIEAAQAAGARGIVLAGVGSGNVHAQSLEAARRAASQGIAIVRASRTGGGMVERNVEVDDEESGFITAGDLNPQKARVLLQVALTHTSSPAAIQELFDQL
jgi:L-asparaginase